MEIPIPEHLKDLWETWDLRVFILLSLFLQTFLTIFAPLRKRTANNWLILSLWSAYVLADWAASFAVGTITSSQSEKFGFGNAKTSTNDVDIMTFWAPFLLVHLGGPDTITAFALEDNELWNRVMLGLIFQFLAAVYVFYLSLPKNQLLIPTTLMFVSGLIKSFEKTRTLHLASLDRFRDSLLKAPEPGPNYARLMDEYSLKAQTNRQASMTANTKPYLASANVAKVEIFSSREPRKMPSNW